MHHADYILLRSVNFNKDLIINKFSNLLDDILEQFRADGFDKAVATIAKCVPDEAHLGLIDGAIKGKCEKLQVNGHLTDKQFDNYVPKIFANLTIKEQFYVLAHTDLTLLRNKVDQPNPVFANLIYSVIRRILVNKS